MQQTAGYSKTKLAKKLGIKEGFTIRLVNEPSYYWQLFEDIPKEIEIVADQKSKKDFIHYFAKNKKGLQKDIFTLRNEIKPNGMVWISWPKKSSKIVTDIMENDVRNTALASGLVDIKVCAVDDVWSGLKFVIRVKDRKGEGE
jgi:ribosomal protein L22